MATSSPRYLHHRPKSAGRSVDEDPKVGLQAFEDASEASSTESCPCLFIAQVGIRYDIEATGVGLQVCRCRHLVKSLFDRLLTVPSSLNASSMHSESLASALELCLYDA